MRVHPDFPLLRWCVDEFEFTGFDRPKAPRAPIPQAKRHTGALRGSAFYGPGAFAAHGVEGG